MRLGAFRSVTVSEGRRWVRRPGAILAVMVLLAMLWPGAGAGSSSVANHGEAVAAIAVDDLHGGCRAPVHHGVSGPCGHAVCAFGIVGKAEDLAGRFIVDWHRTEPRRPDGLGSPPSDPPPRA